MSSSRRLRLLAFVAIALAACGSPGGSGPTPIAPGVPPRCSASGLAMRFRGWNGATGSLQGTVGVGNTTASRCVVSGYPTVELLDAKGDPLKVTADQWRTIARVSDVRLEPGLGDVPPKGDPLRKGQGSFGLLWTNWCAKAESPQSVRVTMADGSLQVVALQGDAGSTPRCDDASRPSILSVGPFEAAP